MEWGSCPAQTFPVRRSFRLCGGGRVSLGDRRSWQGVGLSQSTIRVHLVAERRSKGSVDGVTFAGARVRSVGVDTLD
jgi:hypothetical protein